MTKYEKELQQLKDWDEVQDTGVCKFSGYPFIYTAGHGYLAIPSNDKNYALAYKICSYGFKGRLAVYLEEDCEAPQFIKELGLYN